MTKAETLQFLHSRLTLATIPEFIYFTARDWAHDQTRSGLIKKVIAKFNGSMVIVRSSATSEDSIDQSHAGAFESVNKVESGQVKSVSAAVDAVLQSYRRKNADSPLNQVIVQQQETTSDISGVVFTKDPHSGTPYYLINYDQATKATDGVTAGSTTSERLDVYRPEYYLAPKPWNKLLSAVREIELLIGNDCLDIEFSLTKTGQVVIYQARPLIVSAQTQTSNHDFTETIKQLKTDYRQRPTILSDMAFWNPAEIIGTAPRQLAYSFYYELILKNTWTRGLASLGYAEQKQALMIRIGGKPYIDTKLAFQALLPKSISTPLQQKLVNIYNTKLTSQPELHDKIEFQIVDNCFNCFWPERATELSQRGLSTAEISELGLALRQLTNDALTGSSHYYRTIDRQLEQLETLRVETISKLAKKPEAIIGAIKKLFKDCQVCGVMPFVGAARLAFIAKNIMASCITKRDGKTKETLSDHEQSHSITSAFLDKNLDADARQELFGHLRPGTYDITTPTYETSYQLAEKRKKQNSYSKPVASKNNQTSDKLFLPDLTSLLHSYGLDIAGHDFITFYKQAVHYRELVKLAFTKNVSLILELIASLGELVDLPREKLANVDLSLILNLNPKVPVNRLKKILDHNINYHTEQHKQFADLHYPDLITKETDLAIIAHPKNQPNFITKQCCRGQSLCLINVYEKTTGLANKIVVIERADPGFDWIFTHNIKGLVTKYGGVASHMAIRCNELNIPAAIGCGTLLFEKIKNGHTIYLDCAEQKLTTA